MMISVFSSWNPSPDQVKNRSNKNAPELNYRGI